MDLISGIMNVLSLHNLFYCFLGCLLGTLVGVLPGLGPASTLSILLPITLYLEPTGSIIMLGGLYYGAAYGGSTTSILVNIPGEVGAVATCFDGYPMTKQGRGGEALWIAAVGSFIAGTFGTLMLSFTGPGIAKIALRFGPPEYFGLIFFSLTAIVSLSGQSVIKGLACGFIGLILASLGVDISTGQDRLTFGVPILLMGFDIVPVVVGLFGIGEIFINAEAGLVKIYEGKIGKMMPRGKELKAGLLASCRGTFLGFLLGLLPGMAPGSVAFIAYDFEKRVSKHPEKFGTGVIEGVANVEAANNATAQANFIPLITFGLPTGPSPAIILAALMLFGLQPGPSLFTQHTLFAWTIIGSMYIGNLMLLVLNLPLVGLWARLATIPYKYLGPTILAVCVIGAYSPRNSMFDVWVALGAGVVGYVMRKTGWPIVPMIMGFVFGPLLEHSMRQSIAMGGFTVFLYRPITMGFIILAAILVIVSAKYLKRVPKDDDTIVQT